MAKENYQRLNMKRKVFAKGKKQNFKRFKRTAKYITDNIENQIAREKNKDPFAFTDSEDDMADDLGMGLELTDLSVLLDENIENTSKNLIALAQDSVRPFFANEEAYDESKLQEALMELRYTSFRPNQKEAIKRILMGRSTLFISPTGSGKSLCYQLPALLFWRYRKYITIVVSPLISLMEDQMTRLPKGLRAVSVHSNLNPTQKRRSIGQIVNGEAQIIFISPEAIVGGLLDLDDLKNLPPVGFVCIDEAHCLSEWSHNFRPAYSQFIGILNEKMNIKTFLALTATATKATAFAIARSLTINPEYDVLGSTTIPDNLILSVSYEINKDFALINLLKSYTFRIMPSIIIYCNRREETEQVAARIRTAMKAYSSTMEVPERLKPAKTTTASDVDSARGSSDSESPTSQKECTILTWDAEAYHAGLDHATRNKIQRRFVKGELRVVVATVAFGMGINKSNIRAVIHYNMPGSFESYVQEIGRAGRDGKVAQCHMFLSADKSDLYYQQRHIYSSCVGRERLVKLVNYIFKQRCIHFKQQQELSKGEVNDEEEKLNRLNKLDPPSKSSIIKKHRHCKGHEIAFPVEEASDEVNLWPESMMTIMHQIQQAYPQLLMKQFPTNKFDCTILCYKGREQMENLAKKCPAVNMALYTWRKSHPGEKTPKKFTFDVIVVASRLNKNSADIIRELKKTEWEIVEETGKFRRSQIRVSFDGNSFHALAAGDLTDEELQEVEQFVVDSSRQYEIRERARTVMVYNVFRNYGITVDKMKDKSIRLDASDRIKTAMITYFNSEPESIKNYHCDRGALAEGTNDLNVNNEDKGRSISPAVEDAIKGSTRAFISAGHENYKQPSTLAKIFQGISTPNHPSKHWGPHRRWWRIHVDVDFRDLLDTIRDSMCVIKRIG